jgi:hypothetical protein
MRIRGIPEDTSFINPRASVLFSSIPDRNMLATIRHQIIRAFLSVHLELTSAK